MEYVIGGIIFAVGAILAVIDRVMGRRFGLYLLGVGVLLAVGAMVMSMPAGGDAFGVLAIGAFVIGLCGIAILGYVVARLVFRALRGAPAKEVQ